MPLPADTALLLLGTPELRRGEHTLLGCAKPRMFCLLAYLAVDGPVAKADIASLFWPDVSMLSARANLRQLLHRLRLLLEDADVLVEAPGDGIDLAAACATDVRPFLAGTENLAGATRPRQQEEQLALYRGEFLQGVSLEGGSSDLNSWIEAVRRRCRNRAASLSVELATGLARQECHEAALRHARQALAFDPANQEALHLAMLLYSRGGAAQRALALYRDWERRLVNDVAALPAPETHALYQQIRKTAWERGDPGRDLQSDEFDRRLLSVLAVVWPIPEDDGEAEAAAAALDSLHVHCSAVLLRFGAHLAVLPQGGLLAWFGYPVSQTHTALTAVRATAELFRQVPDMAGIALALHSGSTLCNARAPDVSAILTRAVLALCAATPGGSLQATSACFAALGRPQWLAPVCHPAPGKQPGLQSYRMQWQRWHRVNASSAWHGNPALVGRATELACLHQRWQAARRHECSLVQVSGAAGMGKSHLLRSFLAEAGPAWILQTHCDPFSSDTPLHAILSMFDTAAQAPDGAPVRQVVSRHVPLPAASRRISAARWETARPVTLEALEQVVGGLVAAIMELAAARPLVLVIEDVHWADPSTLAFLAKLGRHRAAAPVLVLASTRGMAPLWRDVPVCRIELGALDEQASQALAHAVNPALDAVCMAQVLAAGGGHPLFLSELARRRDERGLPSSIGELVQVRLDELGSARKGAQMAAILGITFKRSWLQAMLEDHQADAAALDALLQSGLLREARPLDLSFSHALLRDAVIASIPAPQFKVLSRTVGETLTRQFPDEAGQQPEQAARWFTDAEEWQTALSWRLKACRLAISYAAYPETLREMAAGLALLPYLPSPNQRDDWERAFRTTCHQAITPVHGVHSSESALHYRRMAVLAGQSSGLPGDYDAMRALMYATEAQHGQRALLQLLRRLLRMPQVQASSDGTLLRVQETHVHALMLGGRIRQAAALRTALMRRAWPALSEMPASLQHEPLTAIVARGMTLGMLSGAWSECAAIERESLEAARRSRKPLTLAYVLTFVIMGYLPARMPQRLLPLIAELLEISGKLGLAVFRQYALLAQASCRVLDGDGGQSEEMSVLATDMRAYAAYCCPGFLLYLAESWHLQGQTGNALAALAQGEADMARYGMFIYRAEYLILRARLCTDRPVAEALLNKAYRVAVRQGAHAFALRALLALAQLYDGDENATARRRLAGLLAQLPAAPDLPDVAHALRVLRG